MRSTLAFRVWRHGHESHVLGRAEEALVVGDERPRVDRRQDLRCPNSQVLLAPHHSADDGDEFPAADQLLSRIAFHTSGLPVTARP